MYNLCQGVQEQQQGAVTKEQLQELQEIDNYLTKNKVHELLNVLLLTSIVSSRQADLNSP